MKLSYSLFAIATLLMTTTAFAVSYTGTNISIELPKDTWKVTLDEKSWEGYDSFDSGTTIVQVFAPDTAIYTLLKSWKKKNISDLFATYKKSIGSKDMTKERIKKGKNGTIYYASFSFTVADKDGELSRSYGYFCIANHDAIEGAYMVNILQDTPVNQAKAYRICNSIVPNSVGK